MTDNSRLSPSPAPEFKVGDRVQFRHRKERGRGHVIEFRRGYFNRWRVRGDNGRVYLLADNELEIVRPSGAETPE